MTEQEIKSLCKFAVDNGNRPLSKEKKEIIKIAIDEAKTLDDLFYIAISSIYEN